VILLANPASVPSPIPGRHAAEHLRNLEIDE